MRYSKSHKEETRQKLLASARALAKRGGFATTGVDALMAGVGLSGAAFYGYFPSKDALLAAVVDEEIARSVALLNGDEPATAEGMAESIHAYLSNFHAMHPEEGCVIPALGAEISRAGPEVRKIVERGLRRSQKVWAQRLGDDAAAWSLIAQSVGALMLARVVETDKARKEILHANRRRLQALCGAAGQGC